MGIETSGFDGFMSDLEKIGQTMDGPIITKALEDGSAPILSKAKSNIRSRSGDLSKSLKTVISRKGGRAMARIGAQRGGKGYYATFVEYGHGGPHPAGPHPFLAPAFDAEVENAYGIIKNELAAAIKQNGD